jgi:hypothetical protein
MPLKEKKTKTLTETETVTATETRIKGKKDWRGLSCANEFGVCVVIVVRVRFYNFQV